MALEPVSLRLIGKITNYGMGVMTKLEVASKSVPQPVICPLSFMPVTLQASSRKAPEAIRRGKLILSRV